MKIHSLVMAGLFVVCAQAAFAQSPTERQLQAQVRDLEARVEQLETDLRRAIAASPPPVSLVRGIANGDDTAVQGIANGGNGMAVAGYNASKAAPALLGASTGYYGGLFFNITDLGSNSANASAIGLVAQSVYSNALYAQQGGAPGSPGDRLARDNVYPAAYVTRVAGGLDGHDFTAPLLRLEDTTTATGGFVDLVRQGATLMRIPNSGAIQQLDANGGTWDRGVASELLVLSTDGTTTDSTANLLPPNSIIEAVVARVTGTISGAGGWALGDTAASNRFSGTNVNVANGATAVGLRHVDQTGAAGPRQVQAGKVRVTTVSRPTSGAIRVTVFYRTFIPPAS